MRRRWEGRKGVKEQVNKGWGCKGGVGGVSLLPNQFSLLYQKALKCTLTNGAICMRNQFRLLLCGGRGCALYG